ncbi:hypothetical protein CathTA2_2865 [Caldalkalibacillus thermarum TA2.A1]|uniref:DUF2759 domain-containing protein n=1 Tax=Caldalkalibacillus thermarum (strain TA2.A1) TaxID=986075 RepID=F5LAD0_CALTT|nr:DUF2759 family protein [Caldalkalibacillus thermarum]EGL81679.1 hypothetical protein CathTA2_2865 [Caldalkalibacillus thermarum TA2.A1]QZT33271.1 DUF2759 domain-containing protein [Caldalkalibacillus thermarum TA2.A1]GGK35640.1 hypothetical protein GCM10010965_30780 [Caldalkalibacillus thermarum]
MLFIVITSLITILCLLGLIHTARDKNLLGVAFSFVSMLVFGWFSVMTFLEWLGVVG